MNQLIEELAEQADNFTDDKIQMPGEYHPDWHDVRDEKFTELIIRECEQVVDVQIEKDGAEPDDSWERGYVSGMRAAIRCMKEHFGVT